MLEYDDVYDTGFELYDLTKYDVLFNMGYFVPIGIWTESIRQAEPDLPIINCWIGSDILQNLGHYHTGMKEHVRAAKNYINICDAPHFLKELREFFKIEAKVIKTTPHRLLEVKDLPSTPQMMTHTPQHRRAFYNFEMMLELASLNTDTMFAITGHGEPNPPINLPNVKWFSWMKPEALAREIYNSTGMLRMPLHDGYSIQMLEAMSAGRYIVTNIKGIPNTMYAPNMVDAGRCIRVIREMKEPNHEAAEWVRLNYAPEHMAETVNSALERL
jgi:glycosyltransferase involved in cell wall biosynthesis